MDAIRLCRALGVCKKCYNQLRSLELNVECHWCGQLCVDTSRIMSITLGYLEGETTPLRHIIADDYSGRLR